MYEPPVPRHRERVIESQLISSNGYSRTDIIGDYEVPLRVNYSILCDATSHNCIVSHESMDDFVVPDFKKRSATGEVFNNPLYSVVTRDLRTPPTPLNFVALKTRPHPYGGYEGRFDNGVRWFSSPLPYLGSVTPAPQATIDLAVTKAWAEVGQARTMALATIGELSETVGSITAILKGAVVFSRVLKRTDHLLAEGLISPKQWRQKYMEVRYALRPMVYDIKNNLAAFNATQGKPARKTFRGQSTSVEESSDSVDHNTGDSYTDTIGRLCASSVKVRAGVLANVTYSPLAIWGFDLVLESMWELTPTSFIWDWFWNIGNTIASWTPNVGVEVLASWYVEKSHTVQTNEWLYGTINDRYSYKRTYEWSGSQTRETIVSRRVVNPQRSFIPHYDLRLNALKVADLLAITSQMRR